MPQLELTTRVAELLGASPSEQHSSSAADAAPASPNARTGRRRGSRARHWRERRARPMRRSNQTLAHRHSTRPSPLPLSPPRQPSSAVRQAKPSAVLVETTLERTLAAIEAHPSAADGRISPARCERSKRRRRVGRRARCAHMAGERALIGSRAARASVPGLERRPRLAREARTGRGVVHTGAAARPPPPSLHRPRRAWRVRMRRRCYRRYRQSAQRSPT
jgi:hypothetical protein